MANRNPHRVGGGTRSVARAEWIARQQHKRINHIAWTNSIHAAGSR